MAMKGYSTFPKATALLKTHHQIVKCHIKNTVGLFYCPWAKDNEVFKMVWFHGISTIVGYLMLNPAYRYIRGAFNKFPDFLVQAFRIVVDSWKFTVIDIHLMRWLTNFYDFRFKWTATEAIRIHSNKAWLSLLVNFKNAIWTWGHFRRTICNKIVS